MENPDTCVIVPTIREYENMTKYFENARKHGFDLDRLHILLITEDFCDTDEMKAMLDNEGISGDVFDSSRRQEWYESHGVMKYSELVPAASHAETSFGLLYMWANPQFEYGFFIDDDTLPLGEFDFFGEHFRNIQFEGEIEKVQSTSNWVNVLYQNYDGELYPRGYPYAAMNETVETDTEIVDNIIASQGLWTNVPDLDAVRILMDGDLRGQAQTRTSAEDFERDFVVGDSNYLTVCSMNLAFKREIIPAFYQFPMDDNEWDVGRFDDIWSGVLLKRAADIFDKQIYNGTPLCEHNKAPRSTFDDLNNEVPGLELNEHLWEIVDDIGGDADNYAEFFVEAGETLADGDWKQYNNGEFFNHVGEYMIDWIDCLNKLENST